MGTRKTRQRVRVLLATTVHIAVAGAGAAPAVAQQTPAQAKPAQSDQGLDANAQAITLSPIDVQGTSGSTDGYVATSTSVATKSNTPVINIPQSLSVVTKDYAAYSGSYLPASGDQFSSLNNNTLILDPQKFENKEVGVKWNVTPRLLYTAAIYQLDRSGVPVTDPNNNLLQIPGGKHRIRGFETALNGYITNEWQSVFGYAYTDARIANNLSATIVAGNVVQLVPLHQFSWWNKYQFTPMWWGALGAIYFADSFAASDDTVKLPGFVRFDGAIYMKIDKTWKAQLNIENIFNKGYWASADGNNNISPGAPSVFRRRQVSERRSLERLNSRVSLDFSVQQAVRCCYSFRL